MRSRCPLGPWLLLLVALAGCGGSEGSSADDVPAPTATMVATPVATTTPALVSAGTLDRTFGTDGLATVSMQRFVSVRDLRVLPDGRTELLVVESSASDRVPRPVTHLVRVSADGLNVEAERVGAAIATDAVAFDATGAVWIAGSLDGVRSVTRVLPGADGTNDVHAPLALTSVSDLVPLPDGGVLAVGGTDTTAALERFAADGGVDLTFGRDGLVLDSRRRGDDASNAYGSAVIAPGGRILVAGTQFTQGLAFFPFILAYDQSGRPDPTFGLGGSLVLPFVGNGGAIAATPEGGAVLATTDGLKRFDPTGASDLSWTTNAAAIEGGAPTLGANGDLVAVGMTFVPDEPPRFDCFTSSGGVCQREAWFVSRLLPDGSPDTRFGGTGTVVTDTPPPNGAQDTGYGPVAFAPAGRLTVAGIACRAPFVCDPVIARYGDVE